jgi:hypothetical protein
MQVLFQKTLRTLTMMHSKKHITVHRDWIWKCGTIYYPFPIVPKNINDPNLAIKSYQYQLGNDYNVGRMHTHVWSLQSPTTHFKTKFMLEKTPLISRIVATVASHILIQDDVAHFM